MTVELTAEQVRAEAEAWIAENWNPELTVGEWWKLLAAAGYSAPMLPVTAGGRGYGRDLANVVARALQAAKVLGPPAGLGLMLAAPTIAAHGTPEQQAEYIPRILDGSDAWCQLFSEPGAGSDLAGLTTKAELDGDEYVISGQKVWTSGGQVADRGMLIARTNWDVPKHQGITWFAFDMHQPGVTVRPLREMTGRALFNEVFLDEARVPAANVIGGLNNGWAVANTTLMVERASLGSGSAGGAGSAIPGSVAKQLDDRAGDHVVPAGAGSGSSSVGAGTARQFADLARQLGKIGDPVVRQGLAELYTLGQIGLWNVARARTGQGRTGVEGNLAKLAQSHAIRRAREIGTSLIGAEATLLGRDTPGRGEIQEITMFSPAPAIYGGTDQVQRNIVGERGLGLPKEPGDTRNTPFKDLPRNA